MHIDNNFGFFCFLLSHIKNNHLLMPDGKKVSGHVATPFPTKQAGKALAKNDKSKQTPKSSGTFECKSCKRYDSLFIHSNLYGFEYLSYHSSYVEALKFLFSIHPPFPYFSIYY